MGRLLIPAAALALLLLAAPGAQAQFGGGGPDNQGTSGVNCDGMSIDECMWGDMGVTASSVPGMNSCTSTKACADCGTNMKTGASVCVLLNWRNGYCKCDINQQGFCSASGDCKYVGG
jgi:hypothetical protein